MRHAASRGTKRGVRSQHIGGEHRAETGIRPPQLQVCSKAVESFRMAACRRSGHEVDSGAFRQSRKSSVKPPASKTDREPAALPRRSSTIRAVGRPVELDRDAGPVSSRCVFPRRPSVLQPSAGTTRPRNAFALPPTPQATARLATRSSPVARVRTRASCDRGRYSRPSFVPPESGSESSTILESSVSPYPQE